MTEPTYTIKPPKFEWAEDFSSGWMRVALQGFRLYRDLSGWVGCYPNILGQTIAVPPQKTVADLERLLTERYFIEFECLLDKTPAAGREIARMEGQCDEPNGVVYTGTRMEPPLEFEYCPNHSAPGTTPVEVIVREKEC